jgi:hypothetical protein
MMNRGLMQRQMFARGGPVRMQQGGLASISNSLQTANQSLGTAQQQLQQAIGGGGGGMPSPLGGIMGAMPSQRRPMLGDKTMAEVVGNPMGTIGAIQRTIGEPVGMKEGGAAFPDLTGDGQVTQADILQGRGVQMQMGGEPMMAQQAAMMQAPMPQAPMPQDPSMDEAMAQAAQVGLDPSAVEGMLSQVSEGIGNLDEAEDFETVMNSMRGDEAPISERYAELAEVVGEEDAEATPESVLALVQPVMQMAQVDQGIGGLAQEEMSAPVEGNMAGGIMSTVNMGAEVPDPVNFNQGGPVVAMANGGDPIGGRLGQLYDQKRTLFQAAGASPQQTFEDQKRMTQAQMLFDIAQGALAFATPGDRQMSAAERLAEVAQPVIGSIGARAGDLEKFKQAQEAEKRALNLQALGAAESQLTTERASASAMALAEAERSWRTADNAEQRAHELLKLGIQNKFTKSMNESDQDFQTRMAERKLAMQQTILELQGAQTESQILLRGQLTTELAELNNRFQTSLQENKFDFTKSERMGAQSFTTELNAQKFANDKAILALQNDNTVDGIKLRNELEQNNLRLASELRKNETKVSFEQQLERDGILNGFQLEQMDKGHEQNLALADYRSVLAKESQERQNQFAAAEAVLDRAQKDNLQLNAQEHAKLMAEEMRKFTGDQAEIDRAIAATQRSIENSFKASADARGERQLDLAEAAQTLDEKYKLGNLALDELAAKATKLGSDAKTATLNYLTNEERLDAYANGTLADKTTFNQLVLDYLNPDNNKFWNAALGKYVQGSTPQLDDRILQSIKAGDENFYNRIAKMADPATSEKPAIKIDSLANTTGVNSDIVTSDGRLNFDSNVWNKTKPARYDEKIDYKAAIGLSRIYPGFGALFSEGKAEAFEGVPSEDAENYRQAQQDLTNLANDLLIFKTNQNSDERILKFVQELLEKETENLRPGGILLKTDADAKASINALLKGFDSQFRQDIAFLPEYGGELSAFVSEKQVQIARNRTNKVKNIVNELLGFKEAFSSSSRQKSNVEISGGDQSLDATKNRLLQMKKENEKGL